MKAILWVLWFALALPVARAADVGLYELAEDLHSTKLIPDRIGRAVLTSRSNDNGSYQLVLYKSEPFSLPYEKIGLVIGDQVIRFNMGGSSQGSEYDIATVINNTNLIPQVAQFFNAKVQQRHHPGYRMLVSFVPDKPEFSLGESVSAKLRITNVGTNDFTFVQGGRQRGARDNQFAFSTEKVGGKMLPDIGDPINFGGLGGYVTLKAGESHEVPVDLVKWFAFTEAGTYAVRGSYCMRFMDPPGTAYNVIWEDCACAEFTVRIKK